MDNKAIKNLTELENSFSQTPVVRIALRLNKQNYTVYGKLESCGFSGSGKDRIARFILREAYQTGKIKRGDYIVEATSGNTGIAFASLGKLLGNQVRVFIPDWMSAERFKILSSLGAEIRKVSQEENGFIGAVKMARELAGKDGFFCPDQFSNPLNIKAHLFTTIPELFQRININDQAPEVFVAGYGTGGMVMAAAKFCQFHEINCSVHPLEPSSMALLSEGVTTKDLKKHKNHKIEGIMDDFVPTLINAQELSNPVVVDDRDAIRMTTKILKSGLNIGISAGANILGCVRQMERANKRVGATILCDSSLKYLSTDLFKEDIDLPEGSLSPSIEVVDIDFV